MTDWVVVYHTNSAPLGSNLCNALVEEFEGIIACVVNSSEDHTPKYTVMVASKHKGARLEGYGNNVLNYWCRGFAAGRKI